MSRRLVAAVAFAVAPAMLLSGCGAWQAVSDGTSNAIRAVFYRQVKVLNVDLAAREALNADDAGRSTSVAVRVYQLKDRKAFDGASYDDLVKNDKTVLSQDLNSNMAAVLNPGASASLSEPMQKSTLYVAVIALYRVPGTDGGWKRVIEKKELDADKPLKLDLVANQVQTAGDVSGQTATK